MKIIDTIPQELQEFALVTIFSLIIGLEQRRKQLKEEDHVTFGTDRTYAFSAILGYLLLLIDGEKMILYYLGFIALVLFVAIFYFQKISIYKKFGITSLITFLITYVIPFLVIKFDIWFVLLIVTTTLILLEMKESFIELTKRFSDEEFVILAKFLVISGVILPLMSKEVISEFLPISPFKIWLAVVVVSGVSYVSYLLQKFVFSNKGILISAILGGLYSSTVTTMVLAKNSKNQENLDYLLAMILATTMMFVRIFFIVFLIEPQILSKLALPLASLFLISLINFVFYYFKIQKIGTDSEKYFLIIKNNPLEIKIAIFFAVFFTLITILTNFISKNLGENYLSILSVLSGFSVIDPFLLSLLTGSYNISSEFIVKLALIAITSNNILKYIYILIFSNKFFSKKILFFYVSLIIAGLILIVF